eukprot:575640-Pelagomonas_calceolata.AAC.1
MTSEQVLVFSALLTQIKAIAIERNMFLVLDFSTPTLIRFVSHKHLSHPTTYRTRPSSSGHEA